MRLQHPLHAHRRATAPFPFGQSGAITSSTCAKASSLSDFRLAPDRIC